MNESHEELSRAIDALAADRTTGASGIVAKALDILNAARASDFRPAGGNQRSLPGSTDDGFGVECRRGCPVRRSQPSRSVRRTCSPSPRRACPTCRSAFYGRRLAASVAGRQPLLQRLSRGGAQGDSNDTRSSRLLQREPSSAEGRRLAAELVAASIAVTYFSDAAVAHALGNADVVLVGADAIAPTWFLNKTGTRMLAAAATHQGVPVYVVASRDKFVGRELAERLVIRSGEPAEVWDSPPEGVDVRNPFFELIPLDLVTAVISDVGILGTGMIPDVCEH